MDLSMVGKLLMSLGAMALFAGVVVHLLGKLTNGRGLPGDVFIQTGNFTIYVPVVSCLLLSLVMTVVLYILTSRR